MTTDELQQFLIETFPHGRHLRVEAADGARAIVRYTFHQSQIRPGGTLSGPTMMTLADTAMYVLVLSAVGFQPLALTTSLSINFLRRPAQTDLLGEARMLKLGRTLAVGEIAIRSDGEREPCAHAVVTYSIPPKGAQ